MLSDSAATILQVTSLGVTLTFFVLYGMIMKRIKFAPSDKHTLQSMTTGQFLFNHIFILRPCKKRKLFGFSFRGFTFHFDSANSWMRRSVFDAWYVFLQKKNFVFSWYFDRNLFSINGSIFYFITMFSNFYVFVEFVTPKKQKMFKKSVTKFSSWCALLETEKYKILWISGKKLACHDFLRKQNVNSKLAYHFYIFCLFSENVHYKNYQLWGYFFVNGASVIYGCYHVPMFLMQFFELFGAHWTDTWKKIFLYVCFKCQNSYFSLLYSADRIGHINYYFTWFICLGRWSSTRITTQMYAIFFF